MHAVPYRRSNLNDVVPFVQNKRWNDATPLQLRFKELAPLRLLLALLLAELRRKRLRRDAAGVGVGSNSVTV